MFYQSLDGNVDYCNVGIKIVGIVTFLLGVAGAIVWGFLASKPRSARDAFLASVVYVMYSYVAFPSFWECFGLVNGPATQIVGGALIAAVALLVLLTVVIRFCYQREYRRIAHRSAVASSASDGANHDEYDNLLSGRASSVEMPNVYDDVEN